MIYTKSDKAAQFQPHKHFLFWQKWNSEDLILFFKGLQRVRGQWEQNPSLKLPPCHAIFNPHPSTWPVFFFCETSFCLQTFKETLRGADENRGGLGKPACSRKRTATIIFTLKNEVGGLIKALKLFQVGAAGSVLHMLLLR